MKKLLQKLVNIGADLSTRKTLKIALKLLGIKPENIDKLYVDLKNAINEEGFKKIPPKNKILFLPQCLRNSKKCKAKLTELGYKCVGCESCKAFKIKQKAKKLGYKRVFIVPGGSMIINIIKKFKPKAVFGVACIKELTVSMEEIQIPLQGVELLKDGCVNTDVDLAKVWAILE